jgi:hypothetical protein
MKGTSLLVHGFRANVLSTRKNENDDQLHIAEKVRATTVGLEALTLTILHLSIKTTISIYIDVVYTLVDLLFALVLVTIPATAVLCFGARFPICCTSGCPCVGEFSILGALWLAFSA